MNSNEMEESRVLNILDNLNSTYSYEMICKMSEEQKKEYQNRLAVFLNYNKIKEKDADAPKNLKQLKGQSLEELASYLMKISGGIFEVERNIRTSTNEIDQLFRLTPKGKVLLAHGLINKKYELFLGECKNYKKSVDVTYVGKFCSLMLTNRVKLGILFSYHGISGKDWKEGAGLVKKFYLHKEELENRFCIIDFSKDDFIAIANGKNLLTIIEQKLIALQIDTDYTQYLSKHPAE